MRENQCHGASASIASGRLRSDLTRTSRTLSHPADLLLAILDNFRDQHPSLFRSLVKGWETVTKWLPKVDEIEYGEVKTKFRENVKDYRVTSA